MNGMVYVARYIDGPGEGLIDVLEKIKESITYWSAGIAIYYYFVGQADNGDPLYSINNPIDYP